MLPGVAKPSRFRPRFHWELLVCGLRGHALVGLDAAELRPEDEQFAREMDGTRWHRCLRCDSWLPFAAPAQPAAQHPPPPERIELPLRGKPLRDKIVLRAIAIDRAPPLPDPRALLAVGVFLIASNEIDLRDKFYARARRPARRARRADQRLQRPGSSTASTTFSTSPRTSSS